MKASTSLSREYIKLVKPGIVRSNALMAGAGFLFAANGHIGWLKLVALVLGTSAVVASACVFNNYIDRDIDAKMSRTKKRPLVSGTISPLAALVYGTILGLAGFITLIGLVNWLTALLGAIGFVAYVGIYTFYKRQSIHGTLVGSISGAIPPMAGYCGVTNNLDATALLLGFILVCWQMPHFYSIALFREADYSAARVPVLPIKRGFTRTKLEILIYIFLFGLAIIGLALRAQTGWIFLLGMLVLTLVWFMKGLQPSADPVTWGKQLFGWSLVVLPALILLLAIDWLLPF